MEKVLVLFTMDGCPYCNIMKNNLNELNIQFIDMNIDENEEEYDMFKKITGNDFVPAFMIMIIEDDIPQQSQCFAPDRDFEGIDEGIEIIKEIFIN